MSWKSFLVIWIFAGLLVVGNQARADVVCLADIDRDGAVDGSDVGLIAAELGSRKGKGTLLD